MNLSGKVAFVTGASRGIGRNIALELTKAGASVALNYIKDDLAAEEALEEIKALGGYGILIKGDVSSYSTCKNAIDEVVKSFGKIDILVNNAGISMLGFFADADEEMWNRVIDTNLKSVINCSHAALNYMLQKKSGSIINISSIWGNVGASYEVIYSASKGAVNSFTKALAKEIAPSGIRVNAIAPGVINTDMNKFLSQEEKEQLINQIPMMQFGEGEDIGKLAAFLSSDDSKYITGQVITVDGGML
ncbi:elongation factor P 5-aminopentanone reductase [Clostridium omnivorum]|uniref:3-ketoacyl-ACP reductase n=1 Tax=Clostridium omnivorum TaxID=1604902 RepID=A0ABQ5N8E1_9CLOT|nr:SDR family oxidoreductase [Clostridium sp. E14]GLC31493.1 3-ketoacyl-ACP reductase [Clostridium sp. E14]